MYKIYKIRLKSGKIRLIEEPNKELKQKQRQLVKTIQTKIKFPGYVNGVRKTNTITNSVPHVHKCLLFKLDLQDFYHTVRTRHLECYSDVLGSNWKHLCMYEDRLPTGAPTSPLLANLAFLDTDKRIVELLRNTDISYTRYMDDLSFSSNSMSILTPDLIYKIIEEIKLSGFIINRKKSGLILSFKRQEVTGIVVNQKLNYPRDKKLLLRSKLDHLARISNKLSPELQGELAYIKSIDLLLATNFEIYFKKRVSYYEIQ